MVLKREVGPAAALVCCIVPSALLMFALGSLYAWSIFVGPLEQMYDAARSSVSAVFSLATLCFAATMVVGAQAYRFLPAPALALVTCVIAALGLALAGSGLSLWAVALGYGGLFGAANGIGYGLSVQVVNTALPERRGLVTGGVVACYTGGAAVFAPLFEAGVGGIGVNATMLATAAFLLVVGGTAALLLRMGGIALPDPARRPREGRDVRRERRQFWPLWFGFFFGALAGLMALGHAATVVESVGGSARELAIGTAAIALGNTLGRLTGGAACDRLHGRQVLVTVGLVGAAGLCLPLAAPGPLAVIFGLALVGVGYGSMAGAYPVITSYVFGVENASRVYGRLFTAWGAAGLLAPYLAGYLFDVLGDYRLALTAAAVAMLAAIAVHLTIPKPETTRV